MHAQVFISEMSVSIKLLLCMLLYRLNYKNILPIYPNSLNRSPYILIQYGLIRVLFF